MVAPSRVRPSLPRTPTRPPPTTPPDPPSDHPSDHPPQRRGGPADAETASWMSDDTGSVSAPAAGDPVDEDDSEDSSQTEGASLLKQPDRSTPDIYLSIDGTGKKTEHRPLDASSAANALLSETARARFRELVMWREPMLTAACFGVVNLGFLFVFHSSMTVLYLTSVALQYSIAASVVYHSVAYVHKYLTQKELSVRDLRVKYVEPYVAGHVDLSVIDEYAVPDQPPTIQCQAILGRLAGILEGGANELLTAIWDAVMLRSLWLSARIFAAAYLLGKLGAYLDAFQISWVLVVSLFTLPKLWSMRPPLVDDRLSLAQLHTRHWAMFFRERVLSQLPASLTKEL